MSVFITLYAMSFYMLYQMNETKVMAGKMVIMQRMSEINEKIRETSGVRHIVFHENLIGHEKER